MVTNANEQCVRDPQVAFPDKQEHLCLHELELECIKGDHYN